MEQQNTQASLGANGGSSLHDLFALTDEQILEIEPEVQDVEVNASGSTAAPESAAVTQDAVSNGVTSDPQTAARETSAPEARATQNSGGPFSAPEDVRALAELYPGGLNEAKTAAERARVLDDIDRAYFGAAGKSPEETGAARAQLAAMMVREDPAAFREMVFAGLRALEEANVTPRLHIEASSAAEVAPQSKGDGLKPAPAQYSAATPATSQDARSSRESQAAQVAAYAAFEKAANEELERSVGGAISRTIEQALPGLSRDAGASSAGTQHSFAGGPDKAAPLQARLNAAIRQDVEQALKGDRQLSEQIAQILSARRFDNGTRAQVVRLIDDRARQLVPGAAKRALNEWTRTALAVHRGSGRADVALAGREVAPANPKAKSATAPSSTPANSPRRTHTSSNLLEAGAPGTAARRVDYRKLSDEQILDL